MATIEQLYKDYETLDNAKDKAGEEKEAYLSIISGVQGGNAEKRLASQFIVRFFQHFTDTLAEGALNAMFDLCEDEDVAIRKQSVKDMPRICNHNKEFLPRIADVLTQLLQTDDPTELSIVQSSLLAIFKIDPKGMLGGLFSQILQGEDFIREQAIKFLANKIKKLVDPQNGGCDKDTEEFLLQESKKVLQDVTGEEFILFMKILSGLSVCTTVQGRKQLVEIVEEQADLDQAFDASDPDSLDRLMQCVKQASLFFSKNVSSAKFVSYIATQVLPVLDQVKPTAPAEGAPTPDVILEILKTLAELVVNCGPLEKPSEKVSAVFDKLIFYMPLPPEGETEGDQQMADLKLNFSYVECLMFTFHGLGKQCPEFLTEEASAERLRVFRIRLQYFARGLNVYIKQLKIALTEKQGKKEDEEAKIKLLLALKTCNNIHALIKDLFHNPPQYKSAISLSWRPRSETAEAAKRKGDPVEAPAGSAAADAAAAKSAAKKERAVYAPPGGKFSDRAGTYTETRGRGRGGRGRGGGRGSYNRY